MKTQRRFAPTGGEFTPESVARFIGIRSFGTKKVNLRLILSFKIILTIYLSMISCGPSPLVVTH
jgi:hypothetical protein